jgi:hypothetical protein
MNGASANMTIRRRQSKAADPQESAYLSAGGHRTAVKPDPAKG